MARGLSPRTLRDFTYFSRNRVCEASKVCLLKLLRYSPFNPRRDPPNTWFNKNSYRRHAYNGSTPIYFYIRFWNPQRDSAGLWRRWKRLCGETEKLSQQATYVSCSRHFEFTLRNMRNGINLRSYCNSMRLCAVGGALGGGQSTRIEERVDLVQMNQPVQPQTS